MGIQYNPRISTDGLVLALDAANTKSYPGSGTAWTDLSGRGNTGTLTNGPTYNGANYGSIVFDGVDDYVNCGTGLALSGSWTISGFVRSSVSSATQIIIQRSGGAPSFPQNYTILIQNNNKFQCLTSADSYKRVESTTTMAINTWYYVTGLYDATTKILSIYVNGNFEGSSTALVNNPPTTGAQYITLGAGDGLLISNRLTGNIAQASIYNRALSAAEVSQNYSALAGRYGLSPSLPMSANVFSPYDPVYDEFSGTLFGAGQGRYMRQNTDKSVIVYNEIDEVTDLFGRGIVRDGLVLDLDAGNTTSYVGSGTTWTDLSPYGNNGTLTNGPTYSTANSGSIVFDGTNDYTTLSPGNTFAFGTQPFAIEIWINFNSTGSFWYLIDARNSGQTTNWALFVNSSRKLEWFTGGGSLFSFDGLNPTWPVGFNGWKQIVISRENTSTNGLKLYINGVLITSATDATNYSVSPTTSYIGCRYSIAEFATANFSKVNVYNGKGLTAAEVLQNFNALKHRFGL